VNGWLALPAGAFALPAVMLAVHLIFALVTRRGADLEGGISTPRVLEIVHVSLLGFFLMTHAIVLRVALGGHVDVTRVSFAGMGLLLAIIGNYFGKLRRNPWIGIRTPWTLADDEVWARTHRFAGPIFVVGGALITLSALTGAMIVALFLLLFVIVPVPLIYSYVVSRQLRG